MIRIIDTDKIKNQGFFEKVYEVVRRIPKGKVTTYGEIALRLRSGPIGSIALRLRSGPIGSKVNVSPRSVGWALHANRDEKTPCHRVVNREGRLAPNFGFHLPSINCTSRRVRISRACARLIPRIEPKSQEGRLGGDGEAEQRRRLEGEGVIFKGDKVDLGKHLWNS